MRPGLFDKDHQIGLRFFAITILLSNIAEIFLDLYLRDIWDTEYPGDLFILNEGFVKKTVN